jgi:hypothetical protein
LTTIGSISLDEAEQKDREASYYKDMRRYYRLGHDTPQGQILSVNAQEYMRNQEYDPHPELMPDIRAKDNAYEKRRLQHADLLAMQEAQARIAKLKDRLEKQRGEYEEQLESGYKEAYDLLMKQRVPVPLPLCRQPQVVFERPQTWWQWIMSWFGKQ